MARKGQKASSHNAQRFLKKDKKDPKKIKAPKPAPVTPPVLSPTQAACPPTPAYVAPTNCASPVCYQDMGKLADDINNGLTSAGSVFTATVCSGTFTWPAAIAVNIAVDAKLDLSCCGNANDCIIDGGSASGTIRSAPLFTFSAPIELNIQGVTFQNIVVTSSSFSGGGLLATFAAALVTFKHNVVSQVKGKNVST